jgi:hypothetical protein
MTGDDCDDRDAFFRYRFLRARAPEELTPNSVTVVTVVTGNLICCGGKKPENAGGKNQPPGGGNGGRQSLKNQAGFRWRSPA